MKLSGAHASSSRKGDERALASEYREHRLAAEDCASTWPLPPLLDLIEEARISDTPAPGERAPMTWLDADVVPRTMIQRLPDEPPFAAPATRLAPRDGASHAIAELLRARRIGVDADRAAMAPVRVGQTRRRHAGCACDARSRPATRPRCRAAKAPMGNDAIRWCRRRAGGARQAVAQKKTVERRPGTTRAPGGAKLAAQAQARWHRALSTFHC